MSLRLRLLLVLFIVLAGAAVVIWFGIKPSYEDAILEERLTLITEYQQQRIRESDMLLYFWLKTTTELQDQILRQPASIENNFNNYVRLFPDLLGFRLTNIPSGEFIELRVAHISSLPDYEYIRQRLFPISESQNLGAGWTSTKDRFFLTLEFMYQGDEYRITTLFDSKRLIESMTQNVLREDAFTTVWLPDSTTIGHGLDKKLTPQLSRLTSYQTQEIGKKRYLSVASGFSSLPLMHTIYIDLDILKAQVEQLFSQSLIMLIIAFIALSAGGHLLISRVQRPINQFLEDVAPFARYDFDRSFRRADLPELSGVTETMEEIRQKLNHYKRINVERVILQEHRNRLLMNYATEMVAQYDESGNFLFINDQFNEFLTEIGIDLVSVNLDKFLKHESVIIRDQRSAITTKDHLFLNNRQLDLEVHHGEDKVYYFELHLNDITDHN